MDTHQEDKYGKYFPPISFHSWQFFEPQLETFVLVPENAINPTQNDKDDNDLSTATSNKVDVTEEDHSMQQNQRDGAKIDLECAEKVGDSDVESNNEVGNFLAIPLNKFNIKL
jgi:hypothetical protein